MKYRNALALCALIVLSAVALAGCGGPASPSGAGVVLRGTVVGEGTATASALSASRAAAAVITVTVQENPAITTTVGGDGTFTLRGLPEGSFTLVFSSGGASLGTATFSEVKPNQEITVTVMITGATVTVLEQHRNGIGHGDVEIEGLVSSVIRLDPAGESRFLVNGRTVVARPGQTAIREGNRARLVSDVTVGRRVHVKGVWLSPEGSVQPVLAHEIKLQGNDQGRDDEDGNSTPKSCMIEGGRVGDRIELEGTVSSGQSSSFMLKVQGNRAKNLVQVDGSSAAFQCSPGGGPNAPSPDQCRASLKTGAKVHVSGTLRSCDLNSALTIASKIIVQK